MSTRLAPARAATRRRMAWTIFGVLWIFALGAGVAWAMENGGRSSGGLMLLFGIVAMGVSALILHSILSPVRDSDGRAQVMGVGAIGAAGLIDSGGSAGGDGGGAGGC